MLETSTAGAALLVCLAAMLSAGCQNTGDMPPYDGSDGAEADVVVEAADDPTEEPVEDPVEDPAPEPHPDCIAEQTPVVSPGHAPGTLCISCHTMYWPIMTVAGTLYADDAGMTPVMGATIVVTDATGAEVRMVTTINGNFYTDRAVTLPLTVAGSRCPDHAAMLSSTSGGECNSCHGPGARIHLP
ncbi:MAG: hypothetical protein JRG91_19490 [Deltaproteobacteria bacterium]|nr:hypothetical protein [Deltaproteobacteria bacterium]